MTNQNEYLKSTKLITAHYGEEYEHYYNAIVPPVFMNSLNVFETLEDYYDFDRTDKHKYCYGRVQNPTVRILEDKIAALEHGVGALAFASGMAAATTAVLTACKAGSHVVCLHNAYGPLKDFLSKYCTEHLDITLTYVTGDRVEEFEEAVTDATDLIVLESPSSVLFSLQDIRAVSRIARKHQALVYIDNTFCTPIYQQPLDMGADIVMHTTSKYIGGAFRFQVSGRTQRYHRRYAGSKGPGAHEEADCQQGAFGRNRGPYGGMAHDKGPADHGGQAGGAPGRSHGGGKIPGGPSKGTKGELPRTPLSSPV